MKVTLKLDVELLTDGLDRDEVKQLGYDLFDTLGGIDAEHALLEVAGPDVDALTILDVKVGGR